MGNYPQYPIITYTDDCDVHQKKVCGKRCKLEVALNVLPTDEQITLVLEDLLSEDGSAGVIVNTVKRAQQIADILSQHFGKDHVQLLHSCFLAMDRAQKEKELFARAMMECSIQLPRELCWGPDKTIKELEKIALHKLRAWAEVALAQRRIILVQEKK